LSQKIRFIRLELFQNIGFPFSPDGSLPGPSGSDIHCVDAVDEHSGQELLKKASKLGFIGVFIDEKYGGGGFG
jgi:alkylation response protein AidB-like acyl-CoA dehydrogenase